MASTSRGLVTFGRVHWGLHHGKHIPCQGATLRVLYPTSYIFSYSGEISLQSLHDTPVTAYLGHVVSHTQSVVRLS